MHKQALILALALAPFSTALAISQGGKVDQSSQPPEERQAQNSLPMSHDSFWNTLLKTKIQYSAKEPHITAKIPPEVKALEGQNVTLSGFVLPMDSQEKTNHFLLSKRTPTCPFCPPGEPNEVVEVYTKQALPWDDNLLTVHGTFHLINNTDNGIFFVMKDAEKIKPAPSHAGPTGKEALW